MVYASGLFCALELGIREVCGRIFPDYASLHLGYDHIEIAPDRVT